MFNETDIRTALMAHLAGKGLLVPEVCINNWNARVDLACLNGDFHGYEIKSEADSLKRLPRQMESYGKVCSTVTLVCAGKHTAQAECLVGSWVGLSSVAVEHDGRPFIYELRPARPNPDRDLGALASMLWRVEAQAILREAGFRGYSKLRRSELGEAVASTLAPDQVVAKVMAVLRKRDWRGWNGEAVS